MHGTILSLTLLFLTTYAGITFHNSTQKVVIYQLAIHSHQP